MRARLAAPLLVLLVAACGGPSGPAQTQVVPSKPKGTVWGQVLDAATQAPLADVSVSVAVGDATMTAKTDKSGNFSVTGVPAGGTVGVTLSKKAYVATTIPVGVPASAGNFPVDNAGGYVGPVSLFPATGVIHAQIVGYDGALVDGAQVTATVQAAFYDPYFGRGGLQGVTSVSGKSAAGEIDLKGLPDLAALAEYGPASIVVSSMAVDTNGDGIPDYLGKSMSIAANAAAQNGGWVTLELPAPGTTQPLQPLVSNVNSIFHSGFPYFKDSVIGASDPIRIIYNQPVDPATTAATVVDDTETSVPVAISVKQGNVVEIAPKTALTPGGAYWFSFEGQAAGTQSGIGYRTAMSGWFYVPAANNAPTVTKVTFDDVNNDTFLDYKDVIHVTFDRAVGLDRGQSGAIALYLNADLDGSGKIGDANYEAGSNTPIALTPDPTSRPPFPGLVRHWKATLPFVPPYQTGGTPYRFGTNTNVAYVIDFPNSPGIYDADGRPQQADQGQFTVTFGGP